MFQGTYCLHSCGRCMIVILIVTALRTSDFTKRRWIFLVIYTLCYYEIWYTCSCGVSETGDSFPPIFFFFFCLPSVFIAYRCVCNQFCTCWGRRGISTQNVYMYSGNFTGLHHNHALKAKYITDYVFLLLIRHTTWVNQATVCMLIQVASEWEHELHH